MEFGTCDKTTGNVDVNEELIELFYAGQAEVKTINCHALERTIQSVEPLVLTPLVQITLRVVIKNEVLNFSAEVTLSDGHACSSSILLLIKVVNANAAYLTKKL